jgi:hypothetical protein
MPATRTKLVIHTDGGVDDAVAIWWAATSPEVEAGRTVSRMIGRPVAPATRSRI